MNRLSQRPHCYSNYSISKDGPVDDWWWLIKVNNWAGYFNDNFTFWKKAAITTTHPTNSWTLLLLFPNTIRFRKISHGDNFRTSEIRRAAVIFLYSPFMKERRCRKNNKCKIIPKLPKRLLFQQLSLCENWTGLGLHLSNINITTKNVLVTFPYLF